MPLSVEQRRIRAALAINTRYRPDDPRNAELRQELAYSRLEQQIRELLSTEPHPPAERVQRIMALLRPALSTAAAGTT
jgi:hypothetical protein